jgi:hypothetical protein
MAELRWGVASSLRASDRFDDAFDIATSEKMDQARMRKRALFRQKWEMQRTVECQRVPNGKKSVE